MLFLPRIPTLPGHLPASDMHFVAEGKERRVYQLKSDPSQLAKVTHNRREGSSFVFQIEYRVQKRSGPCPTDLPIPHLHGMIDTDLGRALVMDAVLDDAGALAPTLGAISRGGGLKPEHLAALNTFVTQVYRYSVTLYDMAPPLMPNLVYGRTKADASPRFYVIDGFGDRATFPLKTYIAAANHWQLNRRFQTVADAMTLDWNVDTRQLSAPR